MATPLLDLRFVIISGKGGVGRTAVAAALARVAAARGKRVLVAQTNAVARLGRMLGHPTPLGPTVTQIAPGLAAVNMTPRESLHEYALMVLRYETVYRALFDNRFVRGFLQAIPGLDAYAMLGKAWWHTTEEEGPGKAGRSTGSGAMGGAARRPRHDLVILDGPASGHATAMLRIPRSIGESVPAGPLLRDARAIAATLSDPAQTAMVIVTRPEELPAAETVELAMTARHELGITLGPVIVNAMPPGRLAAEPVASLLDRAGDGAGDEVLARTLAMAAGQRAHFETARTVMASLGRNPGQPIVTLPWLPSTDLGPREIDRLASILAAAAEITGPLDRG
jgi:anion-transporting  ArsA/GET3 family ATPase